LKISMLSNQLSDVYDGRRLRNGTDEDEGSGSHISYSPIDDEDEGDSSGFDMDLPVVLDIAGSHRDVQEIIIPTMEQPKIILEELDNGCLQRAYEVVKMLKEEFSVRGHDLLQGEDVHE
uniref:Protein kinase domain-containing protein n=1 Tax=Toxocara canis TaxID=6265 RepID=A0A183U0V7_TOXCA